MAKKIYANVSVSNNTQSDNKPIITDINGTLPDSSGNIDYQFYNKEYINKIIKVLPVSRVGTMDYLPMNINGSFEGATNVIGKGIFPTILENDGTLVYLRAGTNGSSFNYYYSYCPNIRTVTSINPVITNEKFVPNFFTPTHKLISFIGSNCSDILMMNTNNGTIDTYVVSLTNGTLNSTAHQSVEFPRSLITGTNPQYIMVHNNVVYIWCIDGYLNTSEFAISLYTMSVDDIKNNSYSSLTKVSGFNGTNLYGDPITSSPNIKLANMGFSKNVSDKPLYNLPDGNVFRGFTLYWGNNEGSLQAAGLNENIRVAFYHAAETSTQQQILRTYTGISFVYNIGTKKYTLDNNSSAPIAISTTASGVISYDNPYYIDCQNQLHGLALSSSLNRVPNFYITNDGLNLVTFARHASSPEHFASRSQITGFTNLYDSLNLQQRRLTQILLSTIYPLYGSPIGENLIHPTIISKSKILTCCSGTDNGYYFDNDHTVSSELGTERNYSYYSMNSNSTMTGFAPNVNRKLLDNTDYRYSGMVTIVDETGDTKVYGTSFIEGYPTKFSGSLLNQDDLSYSDYYTMTDRSILTNLKNSMVNNMQSEIGFNTLDSKVILYFVPDNSFTKSFAVVTGRTDAPVGQNNSYLIVSEVDVVLQSKNVSSVTITSTHYIPRGIASSTLSSGFAKRQPGMIIAKYEQFTYVGLPAFFGVNTSSSANLASLICKVQNNTKLLTGTPKIINTTYVSSTGGTYEVGVLPSIGFGLFENGDITDVQTKLVFKLFGTTEAQFDAMVANPAGAPLERIVVLSQEVSQGFNVYFTQEVPVLINGSYYKLLPTSIDLKSITPEPENKTFYIYIVVLENVCQYLISTEKLSEELSRTYIGTVITGELAIISIESEKVTRFLTNRISTTKRGSAIPASTGVPSGTGTRWH